MLADVLTRLYASTPGMQRLYAALILLVVATAVACVITFAVSTLTGAYAELRERRLYLGNLLLISEAAKGLDKPAVAEPVAGDIFLQGKSREVIGAELQNWLGNAAQDAGAALQSIESDAGSDRGPASIGLSANIDGNWKSIENVVFRIETAKPVLFVHDLEIQAGSSPGENQEPRVTMRIAFHGITRLSDKAGP